MSLRKLLVIVAVVCLGVVVATVLILQLPSSQDGGTGAASGKVDTNGPVYAYITSQELVLMRGGAVVTRLSRIFDEADSSHNKVVWTHSGEYLALFSDVYARQQDSSETQLISINAQTGAINRAPCSRCIDLIPVGSNAILSTVNVPGKGYLYLRHDLTSPDSSPMEVNLLPNVSLVGSTPDYLVTTTGSLSQRQVLTLSQVDGFSPKHVASFDTDQQGNGVAHVQAVGGGPAQADIRIIFTRNLGRASSCSSDWQIVVAGIRDAPVSTDISAAFPQGTTNNTRGGVIFNDFWWGIDGRLRATISSYTCDFSKDSLAEQEILASPSSVWRLDGQKWIQEGQEDKEPVRQARQLDEATKLVLITPDCYDPAAHPNDFQVWCNTGKLYLDSNDHRVVISEATISLFTPPAQSANSKGGSPAQTPAEAATSTNLVYGRHKRHSRFDT